MQTPGHAKTQRQNRYLFPLFSLHFPGLIFQDLIGIIPQLNLGKLTGQVPI